MIIFVLRHCDSGGKRRFRLLEFGGEAIQIYSCN